jgi:hypothetical protein
VSWVAQATKEYVLGMCPGSQQSFDNKAAPEASTSAFSNLPRCLTQRNVEAVIGDFLA